MEKGEKKRGVRRASAPLVARLERLRLASLLSSLSLFDKALTQHKSVTRLSVGRRLPIPLAGASYP